MRASQRRRETLLLAAYAVACVARGGPFLGRDLALRPCAVLTPLCVQGEADAE